MHVTLERSEAAIGKVVSNRNGKLPGMEEAALVEVVAFVVEDVFVAAALGAGDVNAAVAVDVE